jgi:3-oxoadipate enol-lactonase
MGGAFEIDGPVGSINGIDVAPAGGGVGLPIVLVHGINMSLDVWSDVVERLSPTRRIVSFDLRGHGESSRSGPFTVEAYADDTAAVLDARGIQRAHLVGTSFGGSTAVTLAHRHPKRVATVASIGGALSPGELDLDGAIAMIRSVGVRDFFAAFLPQGSFAPGTSQALIDRALSAASTGRDVEMVIEITTTALSTDVAAIAEAVDVPALVVTGELDMTCPVQVGREFAEAMNTEHVVLPGRGHVVSMEAPDDIAKLIAEHVALHDVG